MPISVMLKPSSSSCNLRCTYCFYHSLSNQRSTCFQGMMSAETANHVISSALAFADGTEVFFTFQGGEPLLSGIDFFQQFVVRVKELNKKGSKINYCLQTNGTLINRDWCAFFKKHGFLVGVSLDGTEDMNSYRLYPDQRSSYSDVIRGIELLRKYGVSFNILAVLTKKTALRVRESYKFFKQNDLKNLQYIPCLRPFGGSFDESIYMSDEDYLTFLQKGFKLYYNDIMRGSFISVRSFDNFVALAGGQHAEQCGMNGFCSTQFVVEGDGSTYPCDFYCTDEWYLGNINRHSFQEMHHSERAVAFLKGSFRVDESCKQCSYFAVCRGGGCKRNRQDKNYCGAYKSFFSFAYPLIAQLKNK